MLAVIDVGNSNIVLGVYEGLSLRACLRFRTEHKATSDELGLLMSQGLAHQNICVSPVEAVCVVSEVPQLNWVIEKICLDYFQQTALWVNQQLVIPVRCLLDAGYQPGADRLVNAYAASKRYLSPVIVIDMGTVTTLDVVNASGEYLGGAIVPGLEISREALFKAAAAGLSWVNLKHPERVIGKNREEQIQIGLILGYAGLIDGLVTRMQKELEKPSQVIATGGLAPFMKQASKKIEIIDPDLTLSGLSLLYQEYKSGTRDSFSLDRPQCVVGHQEAAC